MPRFDDVVRSRKPIPPPYSDRPDVVQARLLDELNSPGGGLPTALAVDPGGGGNGNGNGGGGSSGSAVQGDEPVTARTNTSILSAGSAGAPKVASSMDLGRPSRRPGSREQVPAMPTRRQQERQQERSRKEESARLAAEAAAAALVLPLHEQLGLVGRACVKWLDWAMSGLAPEAAEGALGELEEWDEKVLRRRAFVAEAGSVNELRANGKEERGSAAQAAPRSLHALPLFICSLWGFAVALPLFS